MVDGLSAYIVGVQATVLKVSMPRLSFYDRIARS